MVHDDHLGRRESIASVAVLLRPLGNDDLELVHAINEAEVPAVGTASFDHLASIIDQSVIALVAEVDDGIAGFGLVLAPGAAYGSVNYRWFCERYDEFIYLDRVAVAPRFRRRGIGRALYAEVERLAGERLPTATDFTLEVNLRPRNETSLRFHAELGFVEVGQQETDYGARVSMMAKPL